MGTYFLPTSAVADVIGPQGLLANKARILVTNSIAFIRQFDSLVYIRRGVILEFGSYASLMANEQGEVARLMQVFFYRMCSDGSSPLYYSRGHGSTSSSGTSTPYLTGSGSATPVVEDDATLISDKSIIISEKLRRQPSFAKPKLLSLPPTRASASASAGLSQEHKEQGKVKVAVYIAYVKAASKTAPCKICMRLTISPRSCYPECPRYWCGYFVRLGVRGSCMIM